MRQRFFFNAEITSTYGHQIYYADADSVEEAQAIVENGDGVFVQEEIEVMDLGKYRLDAVEDIPVESTGASQ